MTKRPEDGFKSLKQMIQLGVQKNHIKSLAMCGALEEITEYSREQLVEHLDALVDYYRKEQKYQERLEKIENSLEMIKLWEENPEGPRPRKAPAVNKKHIPVMPEIGPSQASDKSTRLKFERETLGFYLTGHPMDNYPQLTRNSKYSIRNLKEGNIENGETVNIPAVISTINKIRTKSQKDMATLIIEDKTDRISATVFPRQWSRLKDIIEEDQAVSVLGTVKVVKFDDDEQPPIVRVVVNNVVPAREIIITPISIVLDDGSEITFTPAPEQNYSLWQQAKTCADNMQRTRS